MIEEMTDLIDPAQMGLKVAAAMVGAGAFSAALSFMVPSFVDRLLPPPRQDSLWMYLHFERVMPDCKTVKCKDGTWFRTLAMDGADVSLASDENRWNLFESRKRFIDELERYGVSHVKFFHMKERIDLKRTLTPSQENARSVDEIWERTFPNAYALRHYAVICAKAKTFDDASAILDQAEAFGLAAMAPYRPRILEEPSDGTVAGAKGNGDPANGPLYPLAKAISPISKPNPLGRHWRGELSALVTADDLDFTDIRKGTIKFRSGDKVRYACIMTFRDCGEKTSEAIMRDLLAVDTEMTVYHAIEPISQAKALLSLNRGKMASVGEHLSLNAAAEYDEVLRSVEGAISGERASLCFYSMHVMPFADSLKELAKIQSQVTAIMTRTAGTVVRLAESAQPTLMSTVMNDEIWPRRFRFLSTNVATLIYPQRSQSGMMSSDWCAEPLAWFRTVSGDPYPFQFHAHDGKGAPAHTLLIGPTGAGKAQPLTQKVMGRHGSMAIGDLKVGDEIYGEDGKLHKVTGIFPQGLKTNYKVTFTDGRSTECCDEHLWSVFNCEGGTSKEAHLKRGEWQTLPLKEVIRRFGTRAGKRMGIPLPLPVEREDAMLPIAPYTLGALLGDGHLGPALNISSKDQEILDRFLDENPDLRLNRLSGCDYRIVEHDFQHPKSVKDRATLRDRLRGLGLWESRSETKFIPPEYLSASIDQRFALLKGLMDTDGNVGSNGGANFCTVSERLAADVQTLVRSLGGTAKLKTRLPYYTYKGTRLIGKTAHQLWIKLPRTADAFQLTRKVELALSKTERQKGEGKERKLRLRFESFEELPPVEMACIQVDNPSKLYLVDDHVVTHNTSLLTFLASQSMRVPDLRIFLLDRMNGMKIFTTCAGGKYISFEGDEVNAALNPFQLPDSPDNRKFLQRWMRMLAETDDSQSESEISRAISLIYDSGQPMRNRSLRQLSRAAFSPTGIVRKNMELWINPESYGNYFNAEADTLDLSTSKVTAFDMSTVLNDDKLAPPMISYLTHRIKNLSMTTTNPTLVIVDETKPMLRNPQFAADFLQVGLMEGRKLRQAFILCFQSPAAVIETGMPQIIMDQCQTWIFFKNPNARDSEEAAAAYAPYGLNSAEIDFITGRTFQHLRYAILIKRANSNDSAIVDVDLSRLGNMLRMFESDARQVLALSELQKKYPTDEAVRRYLTRT